MHAPVQLRSGAPPRSIHIASPLRRRSPGERLVAVADLDGDDPAPHPADTANASVGRSACELHRETIELELSKGRNAKGIWQDLVDRRGFAGGYQSVKRFIRNLRGKSSPEACAVIETAPGEECQVDYGSGPLVRDADSGKYRRTRLFVLTLGYSRKAVRLLLFRSSSQVWAELHEKRAADGGRVGHQRTKNDFGPTARSDGERDGGRTITRLVHLRAPTA